MVLRVHVLKPGTMIQSKVLRQKRQDHSNRSELGWTVWVRKRSYRGKRRAFRDRFRGVSLG